MQKHIVVNAYLIFSRLKATPEWLRNRNPIKCQQIFWVMIELRHTVQKSIPSIFICLEALLDEVRSLFAEKMVCAGVDISNVMRHFAQYRLIVTVLLDGDVQHRVSAVSGDGAITMFARLDNITTILHLEYRLLQFTSHLGNATISETQIFPRMNVFGAL